MVKVVHRNQLHNHCTVTTKPVRYTAVYTSTTALLATTLPPSMSRTHTHTRAHISKYVLHTHTHTHSLSLNSQLCCFENWPKNKIIDSMSGWLLNCFPAYTDLKKIIWNRMTASVLKQDPDTKRFKQTLIYFNTNTSTLLLANTLLPSMSRTHTHKYFYTLSLILNCVKINKSLE